MSMDKEKSKSNRSSLSYIKWCYGLDKEEQREIRFKEKFGNIREEEVRTECEAIRFLKEELLICRYYNSFLPHVSTTKFIHSSNVASSLIGLR